MEQENEETKWSRNKIRKFTSLCVVILKKKWIGSPIEWLKEKQNEETRGLEGMIVNVRNYKTRGTKPVPGLISSTYSSLMA